MNGIFYKAIKPNGVTPMWLRPPIPNSVEIGTVRVEIERVNTHGCRYHYVTNHTVGWWPGLESNDWIEYIPPSPEDTAFWEKR